MVDPYVTAAQKRIQSRERIAGMSPQQLEQMRAQGIQQVQQDFGDTSQGILDFASYLRQNPDKLAEVVARAGAGAIPGAGVAEFSGLAPDIAPGSGYAPGFMDLIRERKFGDAAAQAALLGLDLAQLSGVATVPITAAKFSRGLTRGVGSIYDDFVEADPRRLNISSGRGSDGGDDLSFEERIARGKKLRQEKRLEAGKKIENIMDQIDPALKMFQQPRAVRELAEDPFVKDLLNQSTAVDDLREFDSTFRGDYLLDVLKNEGFQPRATSPKKAEEVFEFLGDEGLGAEHPSIFNEIEKYTTDINEYGADKLEVLRTRSDYPAYKEDLDRTLLQAYPDGKIPVSRRKPYAPLTTKPPIKTEEFVDLKDVAFVGYDAEKELIVNTSVGLRSFRLLSDAVEMTPEQIQKQITDAENFFDDFPEEAAQAGLDSEIDRLQDLLDKKQGGFGPNELSDLSTPELVTSWVVEPAKVNRAEVAGRLASDPSAVARTNARLTALGYGETVPMFRLVGIDNQGNFKPEGLISATLDPKKVPSNINFFTEGKFDMFNPAKYVLVRYDVPREKIAAYLPAVSEDINRNVNKAVKEKGFGQKKIKGLKTVTNPAVHAKNLINAQDEIFADVSGLKPNFLLDKKGQPMSMLSIGAIIPKAVAEGDFDSPEDIQKLFGNNTFVLDFRDFTDSDAFEEAEAQARQNLVDEYKKFFKTKNFANGGLASLAPIARNMFRGPRALQSLAPVARNMDRSMLRSG